MGYGYFCTFVYKYLAPPKHHGNWIELKRRRIIVDANSFLFYIYDQILQEPERKQLNEARLTNTSFMKKSYWKEIENFFSKLGKDSNVTVVFDGIFKSHKDKRPDPHRYSSERFSALLREQNQLPVLFREQFMSILGKLKIDVRVARGEADPMVASLAKQEGACVLAWDSDYHLYDLPEGYVPLRHLDRDKLHGPLYRMRDVFSELDASGAGLFAAVVGYDYISFEQLEVRWNIFAQK